MVDLREIVDEVREGEDPVFVFVHRLPQDVEILLTPDVGQPELPQQVSQFFYAPNIAFIPFAQVWGKDLFHEVHRVQGRVLLQLNFLFVLGFYPI